MEAGINVEKSAQESKEGQLIVNHNLKDSERITETDASDSEMLVADDISNSVDTSENNIDTQEKQCASDFSIHQENVDSIAAFKKPTVLIGPKRSRPMRNISKIPLQIDTYSPETNDDSSLYDTKSVGHTQEQPFPYVEPSWGGKPQGSYKVEVLKSGVIVDTTSLNERSFHVVGRLPSCHISLGHPTISRYHAVLQYRSVEADENQKGLYVYDLGSTHGTFWNGNLIKPNVYVRIRGGHMLRFGCSQRKYIFQAPLDDHEEESQYSLTELKGLKASKMKTQGKNELVVATNENNERDGIDWGMSEDADEETDQQENPYASIADEDLVLEDPKKTLRGWFEREGYELHYQTEEKGIGQFLCWVDLPMEDIVGHSMRAEALVKGKKKEAVVQCALEACKILDKYGLLRQANHEARKRRAKNWEAEDYYDSDEDNFLDRTGSVERKREHRMRLAGKLEEKIETYDTLLEKHEQVTKRISHLTTSIRNWQNANATENDPAGEDALDAFMSSLNSFTLTKSDITKMKLELQGLRKEETDLIKLLNLTRPANLPILSCPDTTDRTVAHVVPVTPSETTAIAGSMFHARRKKKKHGNCHEGASTIVETVTEAEVEEEMDSDDNNDPISSSKDDSEVRGPTTDIIDKKTAASIDRTEKEQQQQQQHKAPVTKNRRQVQQKVRCDQDMHADNYSTWIPPQDQAGDGKTSLNEKYGY